MKDTPTNSTILCWPKKVLSADDLRRHLTSQRELRLLPRTVITPLAADELKARGIRVSWGETTAAERSPRHGAWCYVVPKNCNLVDSVVNALERDGIALNRLEFTSVRKFAESIGVAHQGGIVLGGQSATVCCIANKVAGIRAAAAINAGQIAAVQKGLGANLVAVETADRSFFELRQILKAIVSVNTGCPPEIATVLKELDGHAHR